jgi:DNA topoisomerase-1
MKLVIVESPTKSKTIGHYLGSEYEVKASVGHIRDLAICGKEGLGVDVNDNFKPTYKVDPKKTAVVKELKALAKKADEVILATDPDREGEAIAWHLVDVLGLPIETTKRLEFHEITKDSILDALKHPTTLNMKEVHSQEARRIIDRILGFKLSKLLQSKIKSRSAGRVQSVTLMLLNEREKEIAAFVPVESWTVDLSIIYKNNELPLNLVSYKGNKVELKTEKEAQDVIATLGKSAFVSSIQDSKKVIASKEPFRTSTLEQDAYSKLHFKTKETAFLAQKLYEGIELPEGLTGLITYMRTDSTRISDTYANAAKDYIISTYGEKYYKGVHASKSVKGQQDAHECIRPTSIDRTPEKMKSFLDDKSFKLYQLIYNRTLASMMSDKIMNITTVKLNSNEAVFETKGSVVLFPGYDILKFDELETESSINFKTNEIFDFSKISCSQHFTKPPLRYTEGGVVKLMEDNGIGRPSTYSATIQTLLKRKYVVSEKGSLIPTDQGKLTSTVLVKYFPDLMNVGYTADMELNLDKIQDGEIDELKVISDFYYPFVEHFNEVKKEMYPEEEKTTGNICPNCGSPLVIKHGRYGDFEACSNYPKCKYIVKKAKEPAKEVGRNCPTCGSPLVYRVNKKGDTFIGCSNFPKCRYIEVKEDEVITNAPKKVCPDCGHDLVLRKSKKGYFYGCSNFPKCKHIEAYTPEVKDGESK